MTHSPLKDPTKLSTVRRRKYKSGTSFCFWRWTDVDSDNGSWLVRLHVIKTPWWAICVHWINKPDPEPFHHDHPVSFLSIILRGAYTEQRPVRYEQDYWTRTKVVERTHRWFNFIRATDMHTISAVAVGTVTLCFMGPKRREWGFHTPGGWIMWKDYYAAKRAGLK